VKMLLVRVLGSFGLLYPQRSYLCVTLVLTSGGARS
jgi:hypothetical protein